LLNTVLLGVVEKQLHNEVFPAEMERKLAQLLSEVPTRRRVWRRATVAAGNSVVQVLLTEGRGVGNRGEARWKKAVFVQAGKSWCKMTVLLNVAALQDNSESRQKPWRLVGLALDYEEHSRELTTGFLYHHEALVLKSKFLTHQQLILLYGTSCILERSH
jgi:hypothetical protein